MTFLHCMVLNYTITIFLFLDDFLDEFYFYMISIYYLYFYILQKRNVDIN